MGLQVKWQTSKGCSSTIKLKTHTAILANTQTKNIQLSVKPSIINYSFTWNLKRRWAEQMQGCWDLTTKRFNTFTHVKYHLHSLVRTTEPLYDNNFAFVFTLSSKASTTKQFKSKNRQKMHSCSHRARLDLKMLMWNLFEKARAYFRYTENRESNVIESKRCASITVKFWIHSVSFLCNDSVYTNSKLTNNVIFKNNYDESENSPESNTKLQLLSSQLLSLIHRNWRSTYKLLRIRHKVNCVGSKQKFGAYSMLPLAWNVNHKQTALLSENETSKWILALFSPWCMIHKLCSVAPQNDFTTGVKLWLITFNNRCSGSADSCVTSPIDSTYGKTHTGALGWSCAKLHSGLNCSPTWKLFPLVLAIYSHFRTPENRRDLRGG